MRHLFLAVPLLPALALAQQTRQYTETTPEGVFTRTETRGAPAVTPLANPNPSPAGLRWTYPNIPGTPWISESVSVGARGTFAWLGQNLNGRRLSLLGTTDDQPTPAPIYEDPISGTPTIRVAAADNGSGCAVALNLGAGTGELRYYVASSPLPVWTTTIATNPNGSAFLPRISANGRVVAVGFNDAAGVATVQVFDALSPLPTTPIATRTVSSSGLRNFDISGDGLTLLIASNVRDHVVDVTTGVEAFSTSTVSVDAHSIDGDGDTFGRGGFDVGAWRRINGTWTQVLPTFRDNTLGFGVYTACDISADGSTFVVAGTDANNQYLPFRVYCWSIANTGATLLWTFSSLGTGSFQDTPQAVSVSDDGRWIAVASWGDAGNTHPEVMLFDRNAGNVPVDSIDTPGSAFDADLSGDGQFTIAGTKSVHANTFGNGGAGYSFDRGGQGLVLRGTASLTRTITLEARGNQGDAVALLIGTSLGAPITVPGFAGSLVVSLATPYIGPVTIGGVPPSGALSLPIVVANDPTLLGASLFAQTIRVGTAGAEIDNHVAIRFTP